MTQSDMPRPPRGLGSVGRQFWRDVLGGFELRADELLVLTEACRVADRLKALADEAQKAPLTGKNRLGEDVANPLLVESRQQAIVFTRLVASLRLPDEEDGVRPQRRGGARGAYDPRPWVVKPA